jgi:hypothetical protein
LRCGQGVEALVVAMVMFCLEHMFNLLCRYRFVVYTTAGVPKLAHDDNIAYYKAKMQEGSDWNR